MPQTLQPKKGFPDRRYQGFFLAKNRKLRIEFLEHRRVLAADGVLPLIAGSVFQDSNGDGVVSAGEGVANAAVQLFRDDGDGVFDLEDLQVASENTNADGEYCFETLNPDADYFVVQPAQIVGTLELEQQISDIKTPGDPTLVIDSFTTTQSVEATPAQPTDESSLAALEVVGSERDMNVELTSGNLELELRVAPFEPGLSFGSEASTIGTRLITWDGIDGDGDALALGLGGIDLTDDGQSTGILLRTGVDMPGASLTLRLYQGSTANFSETTEDIPVTGGAASGFLFLPFSEFSGGVSADNVDAIQMQIDSGMQSIDGQMQTIGTVGPVIQDFLNVAEVDLAVTKTNNQTTAVPGQNVTYTIVATNNGPTDATGATIVDTFTDELTNISFSSVVSGGASGSTVNGVGSINDTVDMPVGSSITYTVTGTVASSAVGTLDNTASISAPEGLVETNSDNNVAIDSDALTPEVDLTIAKTDNVTNVRPSDSITYTVEVRNNGPSDVVGATVSDIFPTTVTDVSYTSVATGNANGNTAAGNGSIDDTVDMPVGSSIVYTVNATVAASASGSIVNTASVMPPGGVTETNPDNNTATDTDALTPLLDLSITKSDNQTLAVPGQTLTYTVVVSNAGPSNAIGATVVDNFPPELTNVSYTSVVSGNATGNTVSGVGNINDAVNIDAESSITYTVTGTVLPSAAGTITNTASVAVAEGVIELDLSNNEASDTDDLAPQVDLFVTKTDEETIVGPNDVVTYTIVVSNAGPSTATGASVVDNLPTALTNTSFTSSVTAGTASGNTADGIGGINDLVTLGPGSSITYVVTATVAANAATPIVNDVTVTAPEGVTETNFDNNSATDIDTLVPEVDLSISKTDNVETVTHGDTVTYIIAVTNSGPSDAVNATVIDNFPIDLQDISYTSAVTAGTASGNTANGTGSINDSVNISAGSTITYTVTATVNSSASDTITNTALVTAPAGTNEPDLDNNSATDINSVESIADLAVTKTNNLTAVVPGSTIAYSIVLTNNGPSDVTGANFVDEFPNSLTDVSYTSVSAGGANGNTITGTGNINDMPNMPAGSTITYTVTATVASDATGQIENTATLDAPANVTDANLGNNSATDIDEIDVPLGSISGFSFVDEKNSGVRDANDPVIAGVSVTLDRPSDPSFEPVTVLTDSNGFYEFANLPEGDYRVTQSQPDRFPDGPEVVGQNGLNPQAVDNVFTLELEQGADAVNFDFGEGRPTLTKRDLLASAFAG